MSVCLSVCLFVCLYVLPHNPHVLNISGVFGICTTAIPPGAFLKRFQKDPTTYVTVAEENVSKNMVFWAFFSLFQSDLHLEVSYVIFMICMGYYQVPPTMYCIFIEVLRRVSHIWGRFRVNFGKMVKMSEFFSPQIRSKLALCILF